MVKLTVVAGPDTGKVFTRVQKTISIGRGEDCDVVLRDGTVSRRHCAIQRGGQKKFSLSDLYTPNGTFLNDINNRIQTCDLRSGDEIIIGKSWLQVELVVEEGQAEQIAGASRRNEKTILDEAAGMSLPKNWQSGMTVVASRSQLPLPEAARRGKEQAGLFARLKRFLATTFTFSRK